MASDGLWRSVWDLIARGSGSVFWSGFGAVSGLMLTLALYVLLWVGLSGPTWEWLCEKTWDRWIGAIRPRHVDHGEPAESPGPAGGERVVVSDLHLDTWDRRPGRREAFLAFLKQLRDDRNVTQFYLNGDLMDLPLPHWLDDREPLLADREGQEPGVLRSEHEEVLECLRDLTRQRREGGTLRVGYLTGNHDIGVSGLRYIRLDRPLLPAQVIWNPAVILEITDRHWIYMEHGHLQDPFLWLYLRNAVSDLLRNGHQRQERQTLQRIQRSGKTGMAAETPGLAASIQEWIARYRWRHAARRTFRRCRRVWGEQVRTVLFGHTHIPDLYVFPGGRAYFNSGDWSGNTGHQTYLVVDPGGTVKQCQWNVSDCVVVDPGGTVRRSQGAGGGGPTSYSEERDTGIS